MTHKVFICHSSHDIAVAETICATLESKHIQCWIAPRDVLPGALWGEAVADAIDESQIVILVLSSNSCSSPQVIREVERAASNNTPIVPLRIDNVIIPKAIGFFVSSRHWLDAQTPPLEKYMLRLTDTVRQLLTQEHIPQQSIETLGAKDKQSGSIERTAEVTKSVQQVLHCPKCGIALRPNASFCYKCGTPVSEVEKPKEAEENAKREAEEARKAKEAEERAKREAEEVRKVKEAEERAKREAEEARKAKEAEENAKREVEEARTGQQVSHCPKCGIELRTNASFCNKCGTRVGEGENEKPAVSVARAVETLQQVLRCPKCGIELRPNASFCNKCGTRVGEGENEKPAVSVARAVETLQQVLRCPKCGTELRPDASFCDKCGTRVSAGENEK
jgi:ribosomal protein L40E